MGGSPAASDAGSQKSRRSDDSQRTVENATAQELAALISLGLTPEVAKVAQRVGLSAKALQSGSMAPEAVAEPIAGQV